MVECWKTHSNKKSDRCNLVKTRRRRITEWKECNCLIDDFIPFPCCLNRPAILQLTKHENSNKKGNPNRYARYGAPTHNFYLVDRF